MGDPITSRPGNLRAALVRAVTIGAIASACYGLILLRPFELFPVARPFELRVWTFLLGGFWIVPFPLYLFSFRLRPDRRFDPGSKPMLLLALLRRIGRRPLRAPRLVRRSFHARLSVLSLLLKLFYLPLMSSFFLAHGFDLIRWWGTTLPRGVDLREWVLRDAYFFVYHSIFVVDLVIFVFGYAVELPFLKSRIRSVDPTFSGWAVALICYPPFDRIPGPFLHAHGGAATIPGWVQGWVSVAILLCFFVYVWATIALMFKASNLTNRGIVASGPYRFVRHPAYAAKNLAWWFEWLPWLGHPASWLAIAGWNVIYVLRAITEERHLRKDPEYRAYCEKVRYRFIPGLI
ncbi:MAG: isoprenylcysteine carboxylmethyltransferase family protein [Pseudomonadota bacterium]